MTLPSGYDLGHAYGLAGRPAHAILLLEGNLPRGEGMGG